MKNLWPTRPCIRRDIFPILEQLGAQANGAVGLSLRVSPPQALHCKWWPGQELPRAHSGLSTAVWLTDAAAHSRGEPRGARRARPACRRASSESCHGLQQVRFPVMCWRQFTKGCRAVSSHLLGLSADTRTQTVTVIGFMRPCALTCLVKQQTCSGTSPQTSTLQNTCDW